MAFKKAKKKSGPAIPDHPKDTYKAYTVIKAVGPGNLFHMRTLTICGDRVVNVHDDLKEADLWSSKVARIETALVESHQ